VSYCEHVAIGHNYDIVYKVNSTFTIQVRIWSKEDGSLQVKSITPKALDYSGIVHEAKHDETNS
jgi:hypothetical protein